MAREANRNEAIAQHWIGLAAAWNGCRAGVQDDAIRAEIDALFPAQPVWTSDIEAWHRLNVAEQRVAAYLTEAQLAADYQSRLDVARTRKIPALATYEGKSNLFAVPPPAGTTLDQRRAVYLSLVQAIQADLVDTRFRRRLRRETATRLFWFGVVAICIALVPLVIYFASWRGKPDAAALVLDKAANAHLLFSSEPGFGLMMVATFGILGAYFSRILSFETKLATIGFEDVMNLYQMRMLVLRLLYGMIGSIIFYYILRSGILGGSAFPDLSKISIGEQFVWKATKDGLAATNGGTPEPSGLTILTPTTELAKLLVWSFIAGFSERLVPDALDRAEAQAKKGESQ